MDVNVRLLPRGFLEFAIFPDLQEPVSSALVGVESDVPSVGVVIHGKDGKVDAVVVLVRVILFGGEWLVDNVGQRLG